MAFFRTFVALTFGSSFIVTGCRLGYEIIEDQDGATPSTQLDDVSLGGASGGRTESGGSNAQGGAAPLGAGGVGGGAARQDNGTGGDGEGIGGNLASGGNPSGSATGAGGSGSGGALAAGGNGTGGDGSGGTAFVAAPFNQLSSGERHTCGISSTGNLHCWGKNENDALGGFIGEHSPDPQPVSGEGSLGGFVGVRAGMQCTCALKQDGSLWCWGRNTWGTLGQGDTADQAAPVRVPLAKPVTSVSLNHEVACAIDEDGDLWCWGENAEGQMGQGDTLAAPALSLSPLLVPLAGPWAQVSSGQGHVCAVHTSGELYCWGRNTNGELGAPTPSQVRTPTRVGSDTNWASVSAAQSQTCGIRSDGSLWCFGSDSEGQLGLNVLDAVTTPTRVGSDNDWTRVETSALHGCGLRGLGVLHCWGRVQEGQLGIPYDPNPQTTPLAIHPGYQADEVTLGRFTTCGVHAGAHLYCTGENAEGELGNGTTTRSYGFVAVQDY